MFGSYVGEVICDTTSSASTGGAGRRALKRVVARFSTYCYTNAMPRTIAQRELRKDNAKVIDSQTC